MKLGVIPNTRFERSFLFKSKRPTKKFDKRKKNPKISIPVALMAGGPPD
jgi:hypothetical protein